MEAVDGGDVGEDPCNDILRDPSLCELSAKYLERDNNTCVSAAISKHPESDACLCSRQVNRDTDISMLLFVHVNMKVSPAPALRVK